MRVGWVAVAAALALARAQTTEPSEPNATQTEGSGEALPEEKAEEPTPALFKPEVSPSLPHLPISGRLLGNESRGLGWVFEEAASQILVETGEGTSGIQVKVAEGGSVWEACFAPL